MLCDTIFGGYKKQYLDHKRYYSQNRATYNWDIIENNSEVVGPLLEQLVDLLRHRSPLRDQLTGVELGDHSLEHLIDYGRQHSLLVVQAQIRVDLRQVLRPRSIQGAERDVHGLHVLAAGGDGHRPWPAPDVEDDGPVEPGDHEVSALADHLLFDALEAVEDDGAVASIDFKWGFISCWVVYDANLGMLTLSFRLYLRIK